MEIVDKHIYNYLVICDKNLASHVVFTVHCFVASMNNGNRSNTRLTVVTEVELVDKLKVQLEFVVDSGISLNVVPARNNDNYEGMAHLTNFAYLRIYTAEYFDAHVRKVVYFDVDCWIKQDITHLFELDLGNNLGAGTIEFTSQEDKKRLDLEETDFYVNTGLFLINLQLWRDENIQMKFLTCYNEIRHKLKWADQDVFNVLFRGRWFLLDPQYNLMRQYQYVPSVIHFNTGSKPWHFRDENIWSRKYVNFRMEVEKDWLPEGVNFSQLIQMGIRVWRDFVVDVRFCVKCSYRYLLKKNS